MFSAFNWQQMTSAFIVLFAVIDIIGSIPIIINLKEKGKDVNALKATLISFALLIGFFYAGDMMLKLFHVDIESFAVAGAFVIFRVRCGMPKRDGTEVLLPNGHRPRCNESVSGSHDVQKFSLCGE